MSKRNQEGRDETSNSGSSVLPVDQSQTSSQAGKPPAPAPKLGRAPSARYLKENGAAAKPENKHFLKGFQLGDIVRIAPSVEGAELKSEDPGGKVVTIKGKTRTRLQPVHVKLIEGGSLKLLDQPRAQPERFESKRDDVARKIKGLECDRRSKVIDRHSK